MAVGAVCVFEGGDLVGDHDALDLVRLRRYVESVVSREPRYRQRVVRVPGLGQPVWVDDEDFALDFHLRHVRLPWPGDDRQLKRLAGRLFGQRIDRDHPLWELWAVEGLHDHRFALVFKVHHCMADGVAGAGLIASLLRLGPDATIQAAAPWSPRPHAGPLAMVREEIRYHNRQVVALARRVRSAAGGGGGGDLRQYLRGIGETLRAGLRPAPPSPLNPGHIGAQRRFDTLRLDLAAIKRVRKALGGTVNDVALAVVAGGLRRYLTRRGGEAAVAAGLRAMVPVNIRAPGQHGGNQVSLFLCELPVSEPDPVARLRVITERSRHLKEESGQATGTAFFEQLADAVATQLVTVTVRIAVKLRALNLVVTNVPGPPVPLYLLGARMVEVYPLVPLYENQALGVALFSYAGSLFVGLSACWHTLPDLHDLVGDLEAAFAELERATGATVATA